jgi:hypothetical protein
LEIIVWSRFRGFAADDNGRLLKEGSLLSFLTEMQDDALAKIDSEINAKAILEEENLIRLQRPVSHACLTATPSESP